MKIKRPCLKEEMKFKRYFFLIWFTVLRVLATVESMNPLKVLYFTTGSFGSKENQLTQEVPVIGMILYAVQLFITFVASSSQFPMCSHVCTCTQMHSGALLHTTITQIRYDVLCKYQAICFWKGRYIWAQI